ncbi:zinc-binding dehydrogenase [Nocardioides sp. YIM 152588]|uniref:zinc-dependent alcohol dehydrogenase n=1 Tax=Nocardioides sp. YIM 152588 TaxID=3158259 RepID=UPI0032E46E76
MLPTAYVISGANELTAVGTSVPEAPLPGHVIVEIAFTGVCASDIDAYRKGYPYSPTLSGHEWSGVVAAVGEGVVDLAVGDRVSRTTMPACGTCKMCKVGHRDLCDFFSLGSQATAPAHGAYTSHIQVPAGGLIRLPDGMSLEEGAMLEPAAVAYHAVRRSRVEAGDTVLLVGAGVIGLFTMQVARVFGATDVVVVEPDADRRAVALGLGATAAFAPDDPALLETLHGLTDGRGADVAYECAGQGSSLMSMVTYLRPGGRLMMISAPTAVVEVVPALWTSKELDVQTSRAHSRDEFEVLVRLFERGLVRTTGVTTEVVPLSTLPQVFERIVEYGAAHRVLVDPRG